MAVWNITGGEKGGLTVRAGRSLTSQEAPQRLQAGAMVEQVELMGERLHYKLLKGTGTGPEEGWISIQCKGRILAKKAEAPVAPGDPVHVWSVNNRRWYEDGVVAEMALQEHIMDGVILPAGSILLVYNGSRGCKWITPIEQAKVVRRQPRPTYTPTIGDAVLVWSFSRCVWFADGEVREKATIDQSVQGKVVSKGSVLVIYDGKKGVKWIPPADTTDLLRLIPPEAKEQADWQNAEPETAEWLEKVPDATEAQEPTKLQEYSTPLAKESLQEQEAAEKLVAARWEVVEEAACRAEPEPKEEGFQDIAKALFTAEPGPITAGELAKALESMAGFWERRHFWEHQSSAEDAAKAAESVFDDGEECAKMCSKMLSRWHSGCSIASDRKRLASHYPYDKVGRQRLLDDVLSLRWEPAVQAADRRHSLARSAPGALAAPVA